MIRRIALLFAFAAALAGSATAQELQVPVWPTQPPPSAAPAEPPAETAPSVPLPMGHNLQLVAVMGGQTGVIRSGITWRIFRDTGDEPQLIQTSELASPSFQLDPGVYFVHATFGLASATRRLVLGASPLVETLTINAGGLVLGGFINDQAIPPDQLRFNVYVPVGGDPEGRVVVQDVKGGVLIRLPEGNYRVVSKYGDSNAITNADLRVEAGKVTEATLRHRAATVTLKLVAAPGTEALANTAFSVLTPGGDTIREAIGAFPSMTLAEGEYVAIARNGGKVYTQEFSVKSGVDRDIEVLVKDTPDPQPAGRR